MVRGCDPLPWEANRKKIIQFTKIATIIIMMVMIMIMIKLTEAWPLSIVL